MLNVSRTAVALALSFTVIASVSDAHLLRDRNFDFADLFAQPSDEIGEMLKGFPNVATGSDALPDVVDPAPGHALSTLPPKNSPTPDQPQPTTVGAEVEILNAYYKEGVRHGQARDTAFTLNEPMMLPHLQTYHWNGGQGTAAPGQIGLKGHGVWQAEGRSGMFDTPNAEWIATPQVILQLGSYSVVDSSPETWAHNSSSQELGFVVVRAAPLSGGSKTAKPVTARLSERETLTTWYQ